MVQTSSESAEVPVRNVDFVPAAVFTQIRNAIQVVGAKRVHKEPCQDFGQDGSATYSVLNQALKHPVCKLVLLVVHSIFEHASTGIRVHFDVVAAHVFKHKFVAVKERLFLFHHGCLLRNSEKLLFAGQSVTSAVEGNPCLVSEFLKPLCSPPVLCQTFLLQEAIKSASLVHFVATDFGVQLCLYFLDQLKAVILHLFPQIADCFKVKRDFLSLIAVLLMQSLVLNEFFVDALLQLGRDDGLILVAHVHFLPLKSRIFAKLELHPRLSAFHCVVIESRRVSRRKLLAKLKVQISGHVKGRLVELMALIRTDRAILLSDHIPLHRDVVIIVLVQIDSLLKKLVFVLDVAQLIHLLLGADIDSELSILVNLVVWELLRIQEQAIRNVIVFPPLLLRLGLMLILQVEVLLG